MQEILDIAALGNGVVTAQQVKEAHIPSARLSEMVKAGKLERVQRGVYYLVQDWPDEYFAAQLRFPKGTFSDDTALFLHGLTDCAPFRLTMTFPRSYHASSVRKAGIEVRTCADEVLELGVCMVATSYGNEVRAYDAERTLCDMVRGRKTPDTQVVNPAMRAYLRKSERNIPKLLGYARQLGVERKIRRYVEVLL